MFAFDDGPAVCVHRLPGPPLLWLGGLQVIGYPNNWVSLAPPAPPARCPDGAQCSLRAGSHSKDCFSQPNGFLDRVSTQPVDPVTAGGGCSDPVPRRHSTELLLQGVWSVYRLSVRC